VRHSTLTTVTEYLRRVSAPRPEPTDADLLGQYARNRDEQAFALLVERHGPMVLGVCRRHLGDRADADDAFQAAFLALARGAGRVRSNVPGWLHRVAMRAARVALRRPASTGSAPDVADRTDPFGSVEWRDLKRAIDDELNQLPVRWRTPLVLSYLEGLSRDEAAQRLGWSLRTFHRRLDEARKALRKRLERRGLAPALLAAAVLSASELRADVSSSLAQQAVATAVRRAAVPQSVQSLIPRLHSWGGLAMKTAVCALLLASGTIVVFGGRQPAAADPPPDPPAPRPVLALAPVKKERPPEDPLRKKVQEAQEKGIAYLKKQQRKQSDDVWNWEIDQLNLLQPGGTSSLAVLALLESGLKPDDESVARGLKYLRTVEPKHTYVVGLQTQVFCRANQKEDADRIKKNVQWLADAAVRNGGKLEGWSYSGDGAGNRADNSNTRYAVAGLYAAHKAGFKVSKEGFWESVREHYVQTQTKDGGWTYAGGARGSPTLTMTVSGLWGLLQAKVVLGKEDEAAARAATAATAWLANELRFSNPPHTFYNFDVIAALGRASERKDFGTKEKKREWYREGCELLTGVKNSPGLAQKPSGEWQIKQAIDDFPVVSTSFALRFLASPPE
jgi:RNA polymerase sigma factor (sigma-70 family)